MPSWMTTLRSGTGWRISFVSLRLCSYSGAPMTLLFSPGNSAGGPRQRSRSRRICSLRVRTLPFKQARACLWPHHFGFRCPMTGRWSEGYDPILPRQSGRAHHPTMSVCQSDHPVLANVHTFSGVTRGLTPYSPGPAAQNTTVIAEWKFNDEEVDPFLLKRRHPLIVEKHGHHGKIVCLNFTPTTAGACNTKQTWQPLGTFLVCSKRVPPAY